MAEGSPQESPLFMGTEVMRQMPGIAAVLIAAGESSRMGESKPLLPWQGKTLLQHQLDTLSQAGVSETIVVLGHRALDQVTHVRGERAHSVINLDYAQGKTTSIRLGIRSLGPGAEGVLVLAVDQPRTVDILERLLKEHFDAGGLITVPEHQGHRGHPAIFSTRLIPELLAIEEATHGLRAVMECHREETHRVPFDTPLVRLDVNSPEEYQEAQRLFESGT